jgi:hypothetical protein
MQQQAQGNYLKPPRKRKITPTKIRRQMLRLGKELYHRTQYNPHMAKQLLFIVGCQRSGTDMTTHIFEEDWDAKVYPEVSELSAQDLPRQLRLNPLPEVKAELNKDRARLIVLKPLVESQNTSTLLDYFPGAKALWLYRDYRAVARSHVKKWTGQNSIQDLKAIVDQKPNNWRYENVSDELRDIVVQHFAGDMTEYDASALYWFVRNRLFYDLHLDRDARVMLCRYEDLAQHPVEVMKRIYDFIERDFPGRRIVAEVNADAIDNGQDINLSPAIERLCRGLLDQLNATWAHTYEPVAGYHSGDDTAIITM